MIFQRSLITWIPALLLLAWPAFAADTQAVEYSPDYKDTQVAECLPRCELSQNGNPDCESYCRCFIDSSRKLELQKDFDASRALLKKPGDSESKTRVMARNDILLGRCEVETRYLKFAESRRKLSCGPGSAMGECKTGDKSAPPAADKAASPWNPLDAAYCTPPVIPFAKNHGATDLAPDELAKSGSVGDYVITQYITARESFLASVTSNLYDYSVVRASSVPEVFKRYREEIIRSNPKSPVALLGRQGTRDVRVNGIRLLKSQTMEDGVHDTYIATVSMKETKNGAVTEMDKTITLEITYAVLKQSKEDQCLNPLGLRVLSYSCDITSAH